MQQANTIDEKEKARFNKLAQTWWDQNGPMWPLHLLNRFRIQAILNVLQEHGTITADAEYPLAGLNVLDIGCGGGVLSESLCKLGAQVTAIDIAENNIKIAKQHAESQGLSIQYRVAEVGEISGQFDLVFNMEVVEHVANLDHFLERCNQMVKPSGITFVATINRTLKSFIFAILGAEYVLGLLPKGTHQWSKFVKPTELEAQLKQNQIETFWRQGVSLNPFTRRFSAQSSLAVNYMIAAQRKD